jgi:polysaccharide biosynthesis/export protein
MAVRPTRSALTSIVFCLITGTLAAAPLPAPQEAPATAPASLPADKASPPADYQIGVDDQLEINVWNESELKQTLPVRSDGKITLPLIGDIQAAGQTPARLQQAIADRLKAFIQHPDVSVMVLQMNSRKFNILGRVARPGSYPLTATTTVLDAIAVAGGFQDFAKQKDVYVLRKDHLGHEFRIPFNYKAVIKGDHPEENIALEPHDTVVVP